MRDTRVRKETYDGRSDGRRVKAACFSIIPNLNECTAYVNVNITKKIITDAGWHGNADFHITDSAPNWKIAVSALLTIRQHDESSFNEIINMLDKNTEEYKTLKFYMDMAISAKKSKLEHMIENYNYMSKYVL